LALLFLAAPASLRSVAAASHFSVALRSHFLVNEVLAAQDISGKGIAPEFVSSDFNTTGGQATVEFAMKYSWTESSH
jgi:hypothetical protein